MNRPNITPDEAKEYLINASANIEDAMQRYVELGRLSQAEANRYILTATQPHHDPVKVIAIRGYYKDSMGKPGTNDRGIYDDAFILMGPNYYKTFNGNTDPRIEKAGVGMLLPGWHLFVKGWHGYGKASGHAAFRTGNAREVLPVLRDGQFGIKDGLTVNMHKGGQYQTNSIACQTIIADQWLEFQRDAYNLLGKEGQRLLPFLLLENI